MANRHQCDSSGSAYWPWPLISVQWAWYAELIHLYRDEAGYTVGGSDGLKALATFHEFPAFPRIAMTTNAVATRGNHPPVWTYTPGTITPSDDDIETRAGTTGVYANLDVDNPLGQLISGATLLGDVPAFSSLFAVPGVWRYLPGTPDI